MSFFFKAFDLFINTAKKLAAYVPQSGADVIQLFQQLKQFVFLINERFADIVGINVRDLIRPIGRLIAVIFTFLFDIVRQIVEKLS